MDAVPPQPMFHLENRWRGIWAIRFSRRGGLEALEAQMKLIDSYRGGNWPQRITDDRGKVLIQNEAARLLFND
jgi:hypothetical protein